MVLKGPPEKPSSSNRRSRWDSSDANRNPNGKPSNNVYESRFDPIMPPREDFAPLAYGFQDLERRTISLADGTSRTYFALPPDPPPNSGRPFSFRPDSGVLGRAPQEFRELPTFSRDQRVSPERASSVKRKYGDNVSYLGNSNSNRMSNGRDEVDNSRILKQAKSGVSEENSARRRRGDVDGAVSAVDVNIEGVNRAFLRFSRMIYENSSLKSSFSENGKNESLSCLVCGRESKKFGDMHALVMHVFHSQNVDLRIDHLGFHKALCVLMGWNYEKAPETSKAYQSLPSETAVRNREDLILWPPMVIIHKKNGQFEAIGSKEIDGKLKDLGISSRRWKPLGPDTSVARFPADREGLREAERAAEKLDRDNRGRRAWSRAPKESTSVYGYLATAADLEQLDEEGKNRALLRSRRDITL